MKKKNLYFLFYFCKLFFYNYYEKEKLKALIRKM